MKPLSLGIIGGMGPLATAVFMERIIKNTEAQQDQDHIDMVVLNHASLPDRTYAIQHEEGFRFLDAVYSDFKLMEAARVANIAIPCNTSHYFYDEMQAMTTIPIINMVSETIGQIYEERGHGTRIGLLATEGTIGSGVYAKETSRRQMELIVPDEHLQRHVSGIIYEQVKRDGNLSPNALIEAIDSMMEHGECDRVVLACTELSCIPLPNHYREYVVDALDVLVDRCISLSGKNRIA